MINFYFTANGKLKNTYPLHKAHCFAMGILFFTQLCFSQGLRQQIKQKVFENEFDTTAINAIIQKNIDSQDSIALILYDFGFYFLQEENEKALYFFKKNVKTKASPDFETFVCRSKINIGFTYSEMGDYEKAKEYYERYLNSSCEIKKYFVLYELGALYNKQGDYETAISMYQDSLESYEDDISDNHRLVVSHYYLGNALSNLNQPQKAIEKYDDAENIYHEVGYEDVELLIQIMIARAQELVKIGKYSVQSKII